MRGEHLEEEEEDYFLAPEAQRGFGAGIRRKRVPFVRSSHLGTTSTAPATPTSSGASIADKYLSIVLPQNKGERKSHEGDDEIPRTSSAPPTQSTTTQPNIDKRHCEICNLPLSSLPGDTTDKPPSGSAHKPHEASLAHQVCLSHSHPPSHLDRTRPGLRYLSSYGWDPDARRGLGALGREGMLQPVKGKMKADTVGLGVDIEELSKRKVREDKVAKLNAKEVRKGQGEARRKGEKLRELFYTSDDVLKYLGEGA